MLRKTAVIGSSFLMLLIILAVNSSIAWFTLWLFQGNDFYAFSSRIVSMLSIVAMTVSEIFYLSLIHLKLWRKAAVTIPYES